MSFAVSVSASWVGLVHCEVQLVGDVGTRIEWEFAHRRKNAIVSWSCGMMGCFLKVEW
jgi:hypothetical protein